MIKSQKEKIKSLENQKRKLEDENRRLNEMLAKSKSEKSGKQKLELFEMKILSEEDIQNLIRDEKIGFLYGSTMFKVFMKKPYILKEMAIEQPSTKDIQQFMGQYEILISLDHINILKAYGIFLSSENSPPCTLLEFCPMTLYDGIRNKKFSDKQRLMIIYQIAEGLRYAHFKKIIHGYLNPYNILITSDGIVKIFDFLNIKKEIPMTVYDPNSIYFAPDIENDDLKEKIDVYSFGVLVFFILNNGFFTEKFNKNKTRGLSDSDFPLSFTAFSKNIIMNACSFNPNDRSSFKEIVEILEKDLFKLLDLDKNDSKELLSLVNRHKAKIISYRNVPEKPSSKLPPLH